MLGHLSKESNLPELAYTTTINEILANGIDESSFNLSVASRDFPGKLVTI